MRNFSLVGTLLVACAWQSAANSIPPRIPAAKFAAFADVQNPVLSPDGQRIAATSSADGKTTLLIVDADQPAATPKGIALGKVNIVDLDWAGNNRLLLRIRSTQSIAYIGEVPFDRLFAIDLKTGNSLFLDRNSRGIVGGDLLYVEPTGSWALVSSQEALSTTPSVKRVDLATGQATVVEGPREDVWNWYADAQGTVRAGVAYEGSKWTLWYRDAPGQKLRRVHGKLQNDNDDSTVDKLIFRGASNWIVTNGRTGRFGLYQFDVNTGAVGAPIFENPEVDLDRVYFDAVTGNINAVAYQDDRSRLLWLDPESATVEARPRIAGLSEPSDELVAR